MLTRLLKCLWVIELLSGISAAQAAITLNANIDSGSLKSYSVAGSTINLVGRDSYAGSAFPLGDGHWRWLYFKASGVQNQNLTFAVSGEFGGDGPCCDNTSIETDHELYDHEMVYSYDGENWEYFPHANNTLSTANANPANDLYTFRLNAPFTQDEVYVAYAFPYAYSRSATHTQNVLASPWAEPTASGNANGVIGQAPAGVDDIGRSQPARDLFAYRITNPATDSATPKRKAMFTTGQHAAETLGIYTYEGLVDWLISDDPRAAALRDQAEFFCYPTLNASGRAAGLTRSMLQHPNTDSNGYWRPGPIANANDWDSPLRTEQKFNGEAMRVDADSTPIRRPAPRSTCSSTSIRRCPTTKSSDPTARDRKVRSLVSRASTATTGVTSALDTRTTSGGRPFALCNRTFCKSILAAGRPVSPLLALRGTMSTV